MRNLTENPHLHKTDVRRSAFGRLPYNDGKANRQLRNLKIYCLKFKF